MLDWVHGSLRMDSLPSSFVLSFCKLITNRDWKSCFVFHSIHSISIHWQANCILLGNILFVLFKKLRSSPAHFRTALRATLLLIPVFGIHYMFYVTRGRIMELCDSFSNFLFFLGVVIDCLQGTFVSIIFCFLNSEVSNTNLLSSFCVFFFTFCFLLYFPFSSLLFVCFLINWTKQKECWHQTHEWMMMHNFLNLRDVILVFSVLSDPEFFSLKITSAVSPPVSFHAFLCSLISLFYLQRSIPWFEGRFGEDSTCLKLLWRMNMIWIQSQMAIILTQNYK